ncbi:MAG TPA: hypothetical protein VFH11_10795 [Gemmatimonadota bacterium]|nr:hypothetical protein [Gemmatimonadota bacterium]
MAAESDLRRLAWLPMTDLTVREYREIEAGERWRNGETFHRS